MKKKTSRQIIPLETIENRILVIRKVKVIVDKDLAELYGVATKRLNEQVGRNRSKFPEDFMFLLTKKEAEELVSRSQSVTLNKSRNLRSQNATSSKHGGRRRLPHAFTEHGALQAANVLNSTKATAMSLYIIRAFVRMREIFVVNQILETRLTQIEKILLSRDQGLRDLYEKIRPLLAPPSHEPQRRIGFHKI